MDVGGATHWRPDAVVSRREMLERLDRALRRRVTPLDEADRRRPADALPAARRLDVRHHLVDDGAVLPDLRSRRLTADGVLLLCLYAQHGTDLRRPLRAGASRETMLNLIARSGPAAPIAAPRNGWASASEAPTSRSAS